MTYTVEETAVAKRMYEASDAIVDIALVIGKSEKSVIGKLVTMGIYKPKAKASKVTGGAPKTKLSYVHDIEAILEVELKDLEKAPKGTLIALKEAIISWMLEGDEDEDEDED